MITEFRTPDGGIVPAISAAQMREVDRIAMQETGPNLFQMMENAGRNLALLTKRLLGKDWQMARIAVLAGTGGNGGGGACAARHLANHGGRVFLAITSPDRLGEVMAWQRHIFSATPGREIQLQKAPHPDLIVDAVIGYNLNGAPRSEALDFINWANAQNAPRISLDAPSGVDSTSGETPGEFIRATTTLTLALPKTGLPSWPMTSTK